jgi:hypothetical protein
VDDELGLAALTFQRHHRQAGGVGGDRRAVVAPDQVQAQVQSRGGAGRGEDLPIVDVEHVRVDLDRRVLLGEGRRGHPVRGRAQAVEQTGLGEGEGATADRRDPGPRGGRGAKRGQDFGRDRRQGRPAGHDDRVRFGERVQGPRRVDTEQSGVPPLIWMIKKFSRFVAVS